MTIAIEDRPQGPYRVHISPADVGRRVAVRRILDDGREGLGDVLGELTAWSDGSLEIRTRDGQTVRISEALVLSGRTIPPPPPRRA